MSSIGLFDSGIGGLTVAKEIARLLPREHLLYYGDTARLPYGEKSPETIRRFSLEIAHHLAHLGVKAVVIACNTASAHGLAAVRESLDIPVIGVLAPGVAACTDGRPNRIGVIGTRGTIQSQIYQQLIRQIVPEASITALPCPLFVPLAEEAYGEKAAARLIAADYLDPIRNAEVETLLLGCTHYPLLRTLIQDAVGKKVAIVDSASATALDLKALLEREHLLEKEGSGSLTCLVSDNPDRFRTVGSLFWGEPLESVSLALLNGEYTDLRTTRSHPLASTPA